MNRNPNWKEEELILALELYWAHDLAWLGKISDTTPDIMTLSLILNHLDLFEKPYPEKFRSVGSIRMKLSNFKSLDSRYGKGSLPNLGRKDKETWGKYANHYDILARESLKILEAHLEENISEKVKTYINRIRSSVADVPPRIIDIYSQNISTLESMLGQAASIGDTELIDQYSKIIGSLQKKINVSVSQQAEHGGINQQRISSTQPKIGEYVQTIISMLISSDKLHPQLIESMISAEWSKEVLHLSHPFLKKINPHLRISTQLKDKNGYLRYWKKVYCIDGQQYVVCKEWFESKRKYFDAWLKTIDYGPKLQCSAVAFSEILQAIKHYDKSNVYISLSLLKQNCNENDVDIQKVVDFLNACGVLVSFQGSAREFNIDDYDLFYEMQKHPNNYTY